MPFHATSPKRIEKIQLEETAWGSTYGIFCTFHNRLLKCRKNKKMKPFILHGYDLLLHLLIYFPA